tara:strand:- start:1223 stop:1390 length:168 start_codon:yes stop_codon:yes gene_type:complete
MKEQDPATVEIKPSLKASLDNSYEFSGTVSECKQFIQMQKDIFSITNRFYIKVTK